MEKKKLNSIYYMVCNKEAITDESLKQKGFSDEDIDYLFDEDRIYASGDEYLISYMGDLLDFAKEKLEEHCYGIANKAIDECYRMSPNDFEVLTLLFEKQFMEDKRKNSFNRSIDVLCKLRAVADRDEIKDANCYLFLLSMLTELPDDLRLTAKYLKLHELTLNEQDDRFYNVDIRNSIRKDVFFQKYSNALRDSKNIDDRNIDTFAYDHTLIKVIEEVTTRRKKQVSVITDLARNDREDEIVLFYEEEGSIRILTKHEEYVSKLAEKLGNIRKTKAIPVINNVGSKKFYDMIDNNDFRTALNKVVEMNDKNPLPLDSSSSYILLSKIVQEIDNIKENRRVKQKNTKNG